MTHAVFPGTFDPITRGHEALIRRATRIFDRIVVGVAAGVHKQSFFSLDERLRLVVESFQSVDNVDVLSFDGLLANFMREQRCNTVIRGLRVVSDFDFELQLADTNKAMNSDIETIFFPPDRDFIYLSSTVVREVALLGGDVHQFVSPHVASLLREKLGLADQP